MKNWSWKAILGGLAINYFGSMFVILLFVIPVGLWFAARGARFQDMATWLATAGPLFSAPMLVFGLVMHAASGYMAAMWAGKNKLAHSAVVGLLSLGVDFMTSAGSEATPISSIVGLFLIVPAALLGGWWCVKTHGAQSKIAPPLDSSSGTPPIAAP